MAVTLVMAASISAGMGVAGASVYFYKRKAMKQRDEEIEEERERERRREKEEKDRQRSTNKSNTLDHFLHKCPLKKVYCSTAPLPLCHACDTRILGWAYACAGDKCKFFLHEVCAEGPATLSPCMDHVSEHMPPAIEPKIITSFAHADHSVDEIFSNMDYKCEHCFTPGCGKRFRCVICTVDLHPVCATHPTKISSYMHPAHELELKTKHHFKDCDICGREMGPNVRLYRCKTCEFYVHPACSQLPQYLLHDLHPMSHPLQLKPATSGRRCDARCGKKCGKGNWRYECKICCVSFHIACVLKRSNHGGTEKEHMDEVIQLLTATYDVMQTANNVAAMF